MALIVILEPRLLWLIFVHGQARVADNELGAWHAKVEECPERILEGQGDP
jgi:hypothetical protein